MERKEQGINISGCALLGANYSEVNAAAQYCHRFNHSESDICKNLAQSARSKHALSLEKELWPRRPVLERDTKAHLPICFAFQTQLS